MDKVCIRVCAGSQGLFFFWWGNIASRLLAKGFFFLVRAIRSGRAALERGWGKLEWTRSIGKAVVLHGLHMQRVASSYFANFAILRDYDLRIAGFTTTMIFVVDR